MRKHCICMCLVFSLVFTFITVSHAQEVYNSTGNNYGFVVRPFAFQLGERPQARAAMERGGYSVTEYANNDTTMFPHPTITEYLLALTSQAGGGMTNTHGDATGQIIEVYLWTSAGEAKIQSAQERRM